MSRRLTERIFFSVVLIALPASTLAGPEDLEFEVAPQELNIGAFFSGLTVTLSGSADASVDVAIEVFGPETEGRFHLKGKVGPLWMNVDELELGNAPQLYFLMTSDGAISEQDLSELGIGLKHLEKDIDVQPDELDRHLIYEQFLKLKRSQGLYDERRGAVSYGSPVGGRRSFRAELRWPSSTAPGAYEIVATGLQGNHRVCRKSYEFRVVEVGTIKAIRNFALRHGLVYGIFCVAIALSVGWAMGMFFKRAGAH